MINITLVDYNAADWSELTTWYTLADFEKRSDYLDYEEVRHLEKPVLHSTRDIEIRTTMYVILQNKKKAEDYYDLTDRHLKFLYVELINTCFDKKSTIKYLKSI
jgi:hypothetical protein